SLSLFATSLNATLNSYGASHYKSFRDTKWTPLLAKCASSYNYHRRAKETGVTESEPELERIPAPPHSGRFRFPASFAARGWSIILYPRSRGLFHTPHHSPCGITGKFGIFRRVRDRRRLGVAAASGCRYEY